MDYSNTVDQKFFRGRCVHSKCLGHEPAWENFGNKRREPNPGILGKKTYWTMRCCGRSMARYREVQPLRCRDCGRTASHVTNCDFALCLCCGRSVDKTPVSVGVGWY